MKPASPLLSRTLVALLAALALIGCSDPATKKVKFLEKGQGLYEKADYTKARLELKNALQIDPNWAEPYYWLGMVELKSNELKKAYGNFAKAAELDAGHLGAQLELGKIFAAARMPDRAREKAELVLAKEPGNRDGLLLSASVLLAEKKTAEARAIVDRLKQGGDRRADVYVLSTSACFLANDAACAESTLQEGIAQNPGAVQLYSMQAAFYSRTGNRDGAVKALKTIVELEPAKEVHKLNLAGLYWDLERRDEAAALLREVVASDPTNEDKRIGVARFYMARREPEQAEKLLRQAAAEIEKGFAVRLALGELYAGQARTDDATAVLTESLGFSKEPGHPGILDTKNALARIYLVSGEVEKAAQLTDEVLKESPRNVDAGYTRGRILLVRNDPLNAISAFRNVVNDKPEFVPAQLLLAEAHRRNAENQLALDTLRKALEVTPDSRELGRALARAHLLNNDPRSAEAQLRRIAAANPQDMAARADLGDFLAAQKNAAAALQAYTEITQAAPELPLGYLKIAALHTEAKALDRAAAVLESGYAANPQAAPIVQALAEVYVAQNRRDKALELCRKRLSQDPQDAFAANLMGKVYASGKEFAPAEAAFRQAVAADAMWPEPYNNLAGLFIAQGKTPQAIRQFNDALASNPKNASAYMALGFIYQEQKDIPGAMQVYEKGIAEVPNFWGAMNNLAFLLAEHGTKPSDYVRALDLANRAKRLQPERLSVADTIGWVYYKMGNLEQALALYSDLLGRLPEDPVLNYHAGMVLLKAGRTDEAGEKLQAALVENRKFYGREEAEAALQTIRQKG